MSRGTWVSFETNANGLEISVEAHICGPGDDLQCDRIEIYPKELQNELEDLMAEEAIRRFGEGEFI